MATLHHPVTGGVITIPDSPMGVSPAYLKAGWLPYVAPPVKAVDAPAPKTPAEPAKSDSTPESDDQTKE